eukprot:scaffold7344_cov145-Cylindrotheca_fusiformis.AAC.22
MRRPSGRSVIQPNKKLRHMSPAGGAVFLLGCRFVGLNGTTFPLKSLARLGRRGQQARGNRRSRFSRGKTYSTGLMKE